jgi:hypothetical protein
VGEAYICRQTEQRLGINIISIFQMIFVVFRQLLVLKDDSINKVKINIKMKEGQISRDGIYGRD